MEKSERTGLRHLIVIGALIALGVSLVAGAYHGFVTVQEMTDDFQAEHEETNYFLLQVERIDPSAESGAIVEFGEGALESHPALLRVLTCSDRCEFRIGDPEGRELRAFLHREQSFRLDNSFEDELNRGEISTGIRDVFRSHSRRLSPNATVTRHGQRRFWTVQDGNRTYRIEGGGELGLMVWRDPTYFKINGSVFAIQLEPREML